LRGGRPRTRLIRGPCRQALLRGRCRVGRRTSTCTASIEFDQGRILDLGGRGFVTGSVGRKSLSGVQERNPRKNGYWTTRGLDKSRTEQLADATSDFACLVFVLLAASARPRVVQLPKEVRETIVPHKLTTFC